MRILRLVIALSISGASFVACKRDSNSQLKWDILGGGYIGLGQALHKPAVTACVSGDDSPDRKRDVQRAIMAWVDGLRARTSEQLVDHVNVVQGNQNSCDVYVNFQPLGGKPAVTQMSNPPVISMELDPNTWFGSFNVLDHEFGHAFGLKDRYDPQTGRAGDCVPGQQPQAVMCNPMFPAPQPDDIDGFAAAYNQGAGSGKANDNWRMGTGSTSTGTWSGSGGSGSGSQSYNNGNNSQYNGGGNQTGTWSGSDENYQPSGPPNDQPYNGPPGYQPGGDIMGMISAITNAFKAGQNAQADANNRLCRIRLGIGIWTSEPTPPDKTGTSRYIVTTPDGITNVVICAADINTCFNIHQGARIMTKRGDPDKGYVSFYGTESQVPAAVGADVTINAISKNNALYVCGANVQDLNKK